MPESCYRITVSRKTKHGTEVAEFINRPKNEAEGIVRSFGPGSRSARREGWKIDHVAPMTCLARGELREARRALAKKHKARGARVSVNKRVR